MEEEEDDGKEEKGGKGGSREDEKMKGKSSKSALSLVEQGIEGGKWEINDLGNRKSLLRNRLGRERESD